MTGKKTVITVETYEVLISHRQSRLWCPNCQKQVAVVSLDDARDSGLMDDTFQREVERGQIHLIEGSGQPSSICLCSLIQN